MEASPATAGGKSANCASASCARADRAAIGADAAAGAPADADRRPGAAAGAQPALPTDDPMLRQVNSLWREVDWIYASVCSSMGLSESSFDILYTLYSIGEGCLQRDICSQMFSGKQTINSSIHKLVAQGYLELRRVPKGRGTRVYLTDAGRDLVERCIEPVACAELGALMDLGEDERRVLFDIVVKYVRDLRERFEAIPGAVVPPTPPAPAPAAAPGAPPGPALRPLLN